MSSNHNNANNNHNNHNKYKSQQNNIPRQSLNSRGPAPEIRTYSNAARQGIPQQSHQSHEGVIPKSHSTQAVQQMVIAQQTPGMASQVSNVNPSGGQMPNSVVNTGSNQMPMLSQMQGGPRFQTQTFHPGHHQTRAQQQRPLLQTNPRPNVPTNTVQQTVGHNLPQQPHQHYFVSPNVQSLQFQNQFLNAQHTLSHTYSHQNRQMQPQPYYQFTLPQQPFPAPQPAYQTAYAVYPPHPYQPHPQASQMMSSQIHSARGASNQAVIQTAQPQIVQMTTSTSNEVNEPAPIPQKTVTQRKKHMAILTDPNSGKTLDIEELAKEEPKPNSVVNRNNESYSGASNQSNALSSSSPKGSNDVNSIALDFATKVAVAATEPITRFTTSPNLSESDASVASIPSSRPEADESVAISTKTTLNELSETNDKSSDICDNTADENNLVLNSFSTNSAPISGSQTDSKLYNKSSAQNTIKFSQIDSETNSNEEINENGDITDSCNESFEDKEEITPIEHSTQKININNNNRKKDMILKDDNKKSEEYVENKLANISDVTDNAVTFIDKLEPQLSSDRSSPVINSISIESVEISNKKVILNELNENHSEEKDNENNRINEIKNKEVCDESIEIESAIPPAKQTLPDLPYKEDQWTPLNPSGKKHYDRDFLIAVKKKSENSLKMPESLQIAKNQEIIRKDSNSSYGVEDPAYGFFLPNFAQSQRGDFRRGGLTGMPQSLRRGQSTNQPGRHQDKGRKIISTSLTQDVKLHTTDNAWKPTKLSTTIDDPEEKETQDLLKRFRGILNKLTPQKYGDLIKQIMNLKIDTEDRLRRVLDLVFEKAVDEPAFCLQYANLCKHLSSELNKVNVVKDEKNVEEIKFHKLLIQKCQKEFETEIYASITDLKERQEEIDNCTDTQKKKMLNEILDEDMRRARKRSLGNIKLIGELYKLNMLKGNIMVQCIDGLIREADDESLECLCALFRTIGGQIEQEAEKLDKQKFLLNNFFERMLSIAQQRDDKVKGTSARVRFMLKDIIDMRNNGWKARRDENLPKMIDEIHLEAQKEDEQTARDLHQHTISRKQEERERKQKGGRIGNESNETSQWTTVSGRKSQNASQTNIDWQVIRSQTQQNHETVLLGPQSGSGNWSSGSRGGAQSQQRMQSTEDKGMNRFTALDSDRKSSKTIPSRDSSKGRSNQSHGYQSGRGRSQRGVEREDAINLARSFSTQRQSSSESSAMFSNMMSRNSSRGGSRETSAPNSRNNSMRRETPDSEISQLKGTNISEEELRRKTRESIKEYLNINNMNEPVLDVTNTCNESNAHIYVSTAVEYAFETSSQSQRHAIGRLMDHLIAKNYIKFEHFFKGLNFILEMAEDLVIDYPKMWDYTAEIVAPIFINLTQNNRNKFIIDLTKMCKEESRSLFVAKIFRAISELISVGKANELWFDSNLNWSEFLSSEQKIEDFVKNNGVEFTLKRSKSSNSDQNYQTFKKDIEDLVRKKKSNDEIQNYISKHFNASETSDHKFTSALFTAVISGCIIAPTENSSDQFSYNLEKTFLQEVCPLLSKFLGGDAERELQALIALQELMDDMQHPSGILIKLFQVFHDSGVISQDAFLQWEKSENSRRGKAVAVKSVTSFLTWLCENEEDEEDNDANS